jgi:hypothetical protein
MNAEGEAGDRACEVDAEPSMNAEGEAGDRACEVDAEPTAYCWMK